MRKQILFCSVLILSFIAFIKIPVSVLTGNLFEGRQAQHANIAVKGAILILLCIFIAKKYDLLEAGGFRDPVLKNSWMMLLPLLYPGLWPISGILNEGFVLPAFAATVLIYNLVQGLVEELVFRGVMQGYLLEQNPEMSYWRITLITSTCFAIAHFSNITTSSIGAIITQAEYAFFMGILFSAIVLRTKNVWLAGVAHGLLNFLFGLPGKGMSEMAGEEHVVTIWRFLLTLLVLAIVFSPSLLTYRFLMGGRKRMLRTK
jgi:membrane protease YdiL (CAAX protease family)